MEKLNIQNLSSVLQFGISVIFQERESLIHLHSLRTLPLPILRLEWSQHLNFYFFREVFFFFLLLLP
jgi:hypothetical protein